MSHEFLLLINYNELKINSYTVQYPVLRITQSDLGGRKVAREGGKEAAMEGGRDGLADGRAGHMAMETGL